MKTKLQIPLILAGTLLLGCSDWPGRILALAIEQLDQCKDGVLQRAEIDVCPALVHATDAYDTDHNGELTSEEAAQNPAGDIWDLRVKKN